jgi:hypothetical protein
MSQVFLSGGAWREHISLMSDAHDASTSKHATRSNLDKQKIRHMVL